MTDTLARRASSGRCVICNHCVVGAWFCDQCGLDGAIDPHAQDRWSTATSIGKSTGFRDGNASAYEIMSDVRAQHDQTTTGEATRPYWRPSRMRDGVQGEPIYFTGSDPVKLAQENAAYRRKVPGR